jgi:DNA-binding transcriptional LysR family regulator
MDRLAEMEAFLAVVDQGGFTEAARKIGASKSALSKHVSSLETRLGVRLLNRTTRRVSPTEIGLAYYDRALQVLAGATEADEMVTAMQKAPRGALRISAPVSFGVSHLSAAIADFLIAYPDVSINMVLEDRFVELVAEGFDLAIRIGRMGDSSLRARKLAEIRVIVVASPEYLRQHGTPHGIDDLTAHTLLHYSIMSTGNFWRMVTPSGEERQIRVGGRLTANNGESLLRAVRAGLGIAQIPSFLRPLAGDLVELLPGSMPEPLGIFAVYPQGRYVQPKLRAFIDFMADNFKGIGPDDWLGPDGAKL